MRKKQSERAHAKRADTLAFILALRFIYQQKANIPLLVYNTKGGLPRRRNDERTTIITF